MMHLPCVWTGVGKGRLLRIGAAPDQPVNSSQIPSSMDYIAQAGISIVGETAGRGEFDDA